MNKFWRSKHQRPSEAAAKTGIIIDADCLKVIRSIGEGQYGFVKQGEWTQENGKKILVAIKYLKESSLKESSKGQLMNELVKEAFTMQSLRHENIVTFYGICFTDDKHLQLVTEFAPMGSLLDNLKDAKSEIRQVDVLTRFAVQIASGMQYLASGNYVHRDLAARNILVFQHDLVKIADFGLTRTLKNSENLALTMGRQMPFAWCSPEILQGQLYSLASDVWSYGIILWEMYSFGGVPWETLDARKIVQIYSTKPLRMLEKPRACPDGVYEVMKSCWELEPQKRPSFQEICKKMNDLHPKHVITKTLHKSCNEDLLDYEEKSIITVISTNECTPGLWLGQHENGQVGLFAKKYTRSCKKRPKRRGKSFDADTWPQAHSGTVRYGTRAHSVEEREDPEDEGDEQNEVLPQRVTNYLPMEGAAKPETVEPLLNFDQDEYVSIHYNRRDLSDGSFIPRGSVHPVNNQRTTSEVLSISRGSSHSEIGAPQLVPTSHLVPTNEERPTQADPVSIPGNSSRSGVGTSQSVPTSHLFPTDEQRPMPTDDLPTRGTSNGAPSWATLPRQKPPEIPKRVDLEANVPNGEGVVAGARERAGSDGPNGVVKRKAPIPLPRNKPGFSGTIPRADQRLVGASREDGPGMAPVTPQEQGPSGEPTPKLVPPHSVPPSRNKDGPSDNPRNAYGPGMAPVTPQEQGPSGEPTPKLVPPRYSVPPSRNKDAPPENPRNASDEDGNSIYEMPWVDFSNPAYSSRNVTTANESQHVFAQPHEHVPSNHVYELPNKARGQATADHIYETPGNRNLNYATLTRPNGHDREPTSPPLPPKDILTRDAPATSGLPEPLRPLPLSPTSPMEGGAFRFTFGNVPTMTSSPNSVEAASAPTAEDTYDKPLVLPPPPVIDDATLHRPPPMDAFGHSPFFGNSDPELGGMTLEFRRAHSERVADERTEPQDLQPSLSEDQKDCVRQVRAVWSMADVDWCCAALMDCDGDVARVVEKAKVEQVQTVTNKDKEHCEFTLKHCNWNVDRAINWIFEN